MEGLHGQIQVMGTKVWTHRSRLVLENPSRTTSFSLEDCLKIPTFGLKAFRTQRFYDGIILSRLDTSDLTFAYETFVNILK